MSSSVLGIDIGSYAAKAMVLGQAKGHRLLGLGLARLPMEAVLNWEDDPAPAKTAVSQALKNLAAGVKSGKSVSASIGGDSVVVKKINLPALSEAELEKAVSGEAEQGLPFPLAEANLGYQVLETDPDTGGLTVLWAATRKTVARNRMEAIAAARLKPAVIDADGLALCNAYGFVNPGQGDDAVLADIGANKITVVVLRRGVPALIKTEPGGGQSLTDEIGGLFNLSQSQAEEVKLGAEPAPDPGAAAGVVARVAARWMAAVEGALEVARREEALYQPGRIHLSGGGSLLTGLADEFTKYFNINTQLFNPLSAVAHNSRKFDSEYLRHIGPQMAVSFGLALRKAEVP
jgi:type IV pilus assembly protein PilM